MPLIINTNVASLNAQRHLTNNTNMLAKSMERLSSGYRINRAADDAAGLALSENLRKEIRGSQKALANVQDGVNVLNLTDGALQQITDNLQRMRELAVQAGNDTYDATQRASIETEMDQLSSEITRNSLVTEFNGVKLLNGSMANFFVQLGPNSSQVNDRIDLSTAGGANPFAAVDATALGIDDANIVVTSSASSNSAIGLLDTAINSVNTRRSIIGAMVNRLEGAANNLSIGIENLSSSESRIRNVDVAEESANLTRNQILQQASSAMLAQANQAPQLALQLLRS